ncbi:MAG: IclR family transcriptional regulator [Acidimicrobiia bacterium]
MSAVQSIERAFAVMEALAVSPAGITDLSLRVDLPKSTVARLLATLESLRAVERTGNGRYRIGLGLVQLSGAVDVGAAMSSTVMPHLRGLADSLGETAGFSVPTGYSVHYLAQVESPNAVQVRDYTGLKLPMHVGPSGLCMMSHWPKEDLDRYLKRSLEAYTTKTVTSPRLIRERLQSVRAEGHCWIYEEFAEGLNSVAAPVLDHMGRVLGALHVHGPAYRFPSASPALIAKEVMQAARQFSVLTPNPIRSGA